jgi:hypothetical protein
MTTWAMTTRLAISSSSLLDIYDVSAPAAPSLQMSYDTLQIGPWGSWGPIAPADWGWAAGSESSAGPMAQHWVILLEETPNTSFQGPRPQLSHAVQALATEGVTVVAAGGGAVSFLTLGSAGLALDATRYVGTATGVRGLSLIGDRALVLCWGGGTVVSPDPLVVPIPVVSVGGSPQQPVVDGGAWLVPRSTNFWQGGTAGVARVETSGSWTWLADAPWISSFDDEDGPFALAIEGGELFLANSESGVLRAPWPGAPLTIPPTTTLTSAVWPAVPARPRQIAHLGDLFALAGPDGSSVGLVTACAP